MPHIREILPDDATGALSEIYRRIAGERGKVANIMTVQSLNPAAMTAHLDLYLALMFGASGLSRPEREMIAVVVSAANRCDYCVNHHAEPLRRYLRDDERLDAIIRNWRTADLNDRERAMLGYAEWLTLDSAAVTDEDVDGLRAAGLSDEDVLNVAMIAAYFNFVNRIANGLGVEFNPEEIQGYSS